MANYDTNLEDWAATGSKPPGTYSYTAGEPPVDAFDNWLTNNFITDIQHLTSLTNSRIESDKGTTRPSSPENAHLFANTGDGDLEWYDSSTSSWSRALDATGDSMDGTLNMSSNAVQNAKALAFVGINGSTASWFRAVDDADTFKIQEYDSNGLVQTDLTISEGGSATLPNGGLDASGPLTADALNLNANWNLSENDTSGNLEASHSGTKVLDIGTSAVNVNAELSESGSRIATRAWVKGGFSLSGDLTDNSGNTIYDNNNDQIPAERVEDGTGSGLDADKVDGVNVYVRDSEPAEANDGDLWFDTS